MQDELECRRELILQPQVVKQSAEYKYIDLRIEGLHFGHVIKWLLPFSSPDWPRKHGQHIKASKAFIRVSQQTMKPPRFPL